MEEGEYYLTSSKFETCTTNAEVGELAEEIVERINGASKALRPRFRPVQVSDVVEVHSDGTRRVYHRLKANDAEIPAPKASKPTLDGKPPPPPQPSQPEKLVAKWEQDLDSNLAWALRFRLLPQQTWGPLYNVYEAIKDDMSGGKGGENEWKCLLQLFPDPYKAQAKDQLDWFRNTANDRRLAGEHARHGRPQKPKPKKPKPSARPTTGMPLADAQSLIQRLLVAWLSTKI